MSVRRDLVVWGTLALAATGWAYWTTLTDFAERWTDDPQYSHGWIVPLFSAYLLCLRRGHIPITARCRPRPQPSGLFGRLIWTVTDTFNRFAAATFRPRWWGLAVVLVAVAARWLAFDQYQPWLDAVSLLVCLAGLAATLGGRAGLRWAWPAVLFLGFMIPLPYRVHYALGSQLQAVATTASTYLLQTVGVPAIAEGNAILITSQSLNVEEACNGLSMLVTFFALAVGYAIVFSRHWVGRAVLVAAAIPVAVGANVVRITATGVLCEAGHPELARGVFHDAAGLVMPLLGVAMLAAVLFFLDRVYRRPRPGDRPAPPT